MTTNEFLFSIIGTANIVLLSLAWIELRNVRDCLLTLIAQGSKRREWIRQEHAEE